MAMDVRVPIHVWAGLVSTTSSTPADRTWLFNVDTTAYDGSPSYELEVIARIANSAQTGLVDVQPAGGGTSIGSVTVDGAVSTSVRRWTASLTPTAGNNTYTVFTSVTGGVALDVLSVNVWVTQTGATKTQYTVPLTAWSGATVNVSAGPTEPTVAGRYFHTASRWANATFQLVSVGHRGTNGTLTIDLYNGSSALASNTHNAGSNVVDRQVSTGFTPTDATEHVVRGTASAGTDVLVSACIMVTISTLSKFEVYHKVGGRRASNTVDWTNGTVSTTVNNIAHRALLSTASFTSGYVRSIYFETVGLSAAASDVLDLREDDTNESGTAGTTVSGSANTITSASKQRLRSGDLLGVWVNARHYTAVVKSANAGTADGHFATVLFVVDESAGGSSGNSWYHNLQQRLAAGAF